ncbi:YtxH domain-containing protein [Candidatus Gracilibacteria bacterium]|nr:YtxH domain-containing protein [Candidatus Gracilibacteria bacterium]
MGARSKIGWLFGLLFGGLMGILFAPRKGIDLRKKIKKDRDDGKLGVAPLQDDVKQIMHDIGSMAKDFYDSPGVNEMIQKGKKAIGEVAHTVKEDFSEVLEKMNAEQQPPVKIKKRAVSSKVSTNKKHVSRSRKTKEK